MTGLPVRSTGPTVEQFSKELLRCLEPSTIALFVVAAICLWPACLGLLVLLFKLAFGG